MTQNKKSILIPLLLSILLLITGIYVFLYSSLGMGGMRAVVPGAVLPDTIHSPSAEQYRQIFENMGERGRAMYIYNIGIIDSIFPFLYTLPLYILLSGALRHFFRKPLFYHVLPLAAIIPAFLDLFENHYLRRLAHIYPDFNQSVMNKALFFTNAKAVTRDSVFYSAVLCWIIIGVFSFYKHIRKGTLKDMKIYMSQLIKVLASKLLFW
ncbi:MAG: hypothetical protein JW982_04595 [Spirochaetes bacterium]|nr:hypothetical protein [Spirochaetota bacterium]